MPNSVEFRNRLNRIRKLERALLRTKAEVNIEKRNVTNLSKRVTMLNNQVRTQKARRALNRKKVKKAILSKIVISKQGQFSGSPKHIPNIIDGIISKYW